MPEILSTFRKSNEYLTFYLSSEPVGFKGSTSLLPERPYTLILRSDNMKRGKCFGFTVFFNVLRYTVPCFFKIHVRTNLCN